jgi:hypothetical protein
LKLISKVFPENFDILLFEIEYFINKKIMPTLKVLGIFRTSTSGNVWGIEKGVIFLGHMNYYF